MDITPQSIRDAVGALSPEARIMALRKALTEVEAENARHRYPTPGALATALEPTTIQTPALELIDKAIARTINTGGRLAISLPPQEGKSTRAAVWTPVWQLMRNPNTRIVVASYAETLARRNAYEARKIVAEHGSGAIDEVTGEALPDRLGLKLSRDHKRVNSWTIHNSKGGGYYATGTGGSLTGRAADLLIIDDPLKDQTQADSAREREKVWEWWTSVAQTRLSPGAAVIVIMTRWHPDDLVGRLLEADHKLPPEQREWETLNIPAVAEEGVPDALHREPGQALQSARKRTPHEFQRIRRAVGERAWYSLYQGQPAPTEGGLFSREDFDRSRVTDVTLAGRIVTVDPAESGRGDEAGLIIMGWDADGTIYVEEDYSKPMKSATWARVAIRQAITKQATVILYEAFTAEYTYRDVLESEWRDIHRQATLLRQHNLDTLAASAVYQAEGCPGDPLLPLQLTLEILDLIPENPEPPFQLIPWRKRGDKTARAAGTRQSTTTGKLRMIGHHKVLETQAVTWQPGQGSPDRVDAMVNGHDYLKQVLGQQAEVGFPGAW